MLSNTLSGRQQLNQDRYLIEDNKEQKTIGQVNKESISLLTAHFSPYDARSAYFAVPAGWHPELTIKACGHMIHPECVPRPAIPEGEPTPPPSYIDFEITCPVCRYYSNVLIPCFDTKPSDEKLKATSLLQMAEIVRLGNKNHQEDPKKPGFTIIFW